MLVVHTRSLFSVSPSFLFFFFSPLRPWFVLSIPEQRAWLILIQLAGWSHISLDKLSGPQQQQLKVLLLFFNHLLVCSLENLFNLYLFIFYIFFYLVPNFFSWFCLLCLWMCLISKYWNMIFLRFLSALLLLSIKLRLWGLITVQVVNKEGCNPTPP